MVGNIFSLIQCHLIGSNIKSLINLPGITVDDFSIKNSGDFNGCGAFSYTGRAEDDEKVFSFRFQFSPEVKGHRV